MIWKPHVTVAAVIEQEKRFLLVEEITTEGDRFNQPAGHLEEGEDIINAVKREVNEETAWQFEPKHILAIQLWRKNPDHPSFLRICFTGNVHSFNADQALDQGIIATHWLSRDEIIEKTAQLRSPLVLKTINAYLRNETYPLSLLETYLDLNHA